MKPTKIKEKLQDLPGVVSVRLESDNDIPLFRVKLARDISDERKVQQLAKECCDLERVDSFENEDKQIILRFA